MRIIDISLTIRPGLVTWDNSETAIEVEWLSRIADGESCNLSRIAIGSHCGTHLDAPLHFIDNGNTVDKLDLGNLIGSCTVVELPENHDGNITALDCEALNI